MTDSELKKTTKLCPFANKQLILNTWVLTLERYMYKHIKFDISAVVHRYKYELFRESFSLELPEQYFGQFVNISTANSEPGFWLSK